MPTNASIQSGGVGKDTKTWIPAAAGKDGIGHRCPANVIEIAGFEDS
jgi:hypothetical protein